MIDKRSVLNPFVHRIQITLTDKIRIAFLAVFIAPIRILWTITALILSGSLAAIAVWTSSNFEKKPISGWQNVLIWISTKLFRSAFFAGSFQYVNVTGKRATFKEAPILLVAPHSSFIDSIVGSICGTAASVSAAGALSVPLIGKIVQATQAIFIDRTDPNVRGKLVNVIQERVESNLDWLQIVVFPEGTCTNRTCLIQFKSGAFCAGLPVQPACIKYPNQFDPVTWTWDGPDIFKLIFLMFTNFHTKCEVEYLPVYVPNEEEKANPELYAKNVQKLMAKTLGIPATDITLQDYNSTKRAQQMNIPLAEKIPEIRKIRKRIGLDKINIENELIKERPFDYVSLNEFVLKLNFPKGNSDVIELFNIFDENQNDSINFQDYLLCAIFLIYEKLPLIEMIHQVFELYREFEKSDNLTIESFRKIINCTLVLTNADLEELFNRLDTKQMGYIRLDEFLNYLEVNPEFAYVFQVK